MTDPLDLEALKERQADRDRAWKSEAAKHPSLCGCKPLSWGQAEADLSRAIQIAEQAHQDVLRLRDGLGELWEALILFRSEKGNHPALEATDHYEYEQHRQAQEEAPNE